MSDPHAASHKRLLDPIDRILEVLFGLIMVLTFTGSLSVAESGSEDIRIMLIGALGCNIAWGVIDGLFYLMGCMAERGQGVQQLRALHNTRNDDDAHRIIRDALPPLFARIMTTDEIASIRSRLLHGADPNTVPRLSKDDYLGALAVCGWVILTTFPVAIPFLVMSEVELALRVSNGIAVVLMFIAGYSLGKLSNLGRWWTGIGMVLLGAALVGLTIALGG